MEKYSKSSYSGLGYVITHTAGEAAAESTLGYPHRTSEFMIYYFVQGSGNIKIEGRQYEIEQGDIIMLNPTELFYCSVNNDSFHERIVLHVNETILKNFTFDCNFLFLPFYKRQKGIENKISAQVVQKNEIDTELMRLLELSKETDEKRSLICVCKVVDILSKLSDVMAPACENSGDKVRTNPLINKVINYLNEHFEENLSIAHIAECFNIDKSYLSHLFKECVGISLWNYVIFRRIYRFNDLIRENHTIEDSCYKVGFQNYSNFFRLYKKYMKMTPMQFKKQIKK